MAEPRATTAAEDGAFHRLPLYNVRSYDPQTNEYGFDNDGHVVNQMRQANDAGIVGRYARDMAAAAFDSATDAAARVEEVRDAIEAIQEGPVVSVMGRTGAVTGLVEEAQFMALADDLTTDVANAIAAIDPRALTIALSIAYTGAR